MFGRRSRTRSARLVKHARLRVEQLEDRSLLSTTPLAPQHLLITTTAGELQKVAVAEGTSIEQAVADYQNAAGVAAVDIDYQVSVTVVPNDTSFGSLYGLRNTGQSSGTADADIDADEAWDTTTGSLATVVGVIDTGVDYRHPDLYLNIWINQGEIPTGLGVVDTNSDGIITFADLNHASNSGKVSDLNGNGYIDAGDLLADSRWENADDGDGNGKNDDLVGWDFVNNDNDPFDDNGHGTHVSGTIGAMGDNNLGVVGVNWSVQIAGLKFLSASGSGSISGAIAALNYAVGEGIKISNNSWGGGGYSTAMANAISNAQSNGHVFVAAAGNASSNNDSIASYPSNYNYGNVVAVASTDRYDKLSSFSNYGASTVDLAAPGSSILSTTPNNTYSTYSGTSMATPHVAGAVALVWSKTPSLTYSEVISSILNNVDTLSSLSGKVATGGRLNVARALASTVTDSRGPRVTAAVANGTSTASSVRVTFSEAIGTTADGTSTFTTDDITNFTGPNGALAVTGVSAVAGSGNKQFDITFAAQTTPGSYSFTIGPNVFDAAGNQMDQDNDGIPETTDSYRVTFSVTTTTTFTRTANLAIRDFTTTSSSIAISQDITISDLNVKIDITHTYDSDLLIYLIGPTGTRVNLSSYRGGSGDNFSGTTFDDESGTAISAGAAPFSGTYRPEQALSAFDSKNARGTWTLYVYDRATYDIGTLKSWSLVVTGSAGGTRVREAEGEGEAPPAPASAAPPGAAIALPAASARTGDSGSNLFALFSLGERREETRAALSDDAVEELTANPAGSSDDARLRQEARDRLFSTAPFGDCGEEADLWEVEAEETEE